MVDQNQKAHEDAERRRQEREDEHKKRKENLDQERKAQVKVAEERNAQLSKLRPTPTPDELNAARAGKNPDFKEPDGSPLQDTDLPAHQAAKGIPGTEDRQATAEGNDVSRYKTRDLKDPSLQRQHHSSAAVGGDHHKTARGPSSESKENK